MKITLFQNIVALQNSGGLPPPESVFGKENGATIYRDCNAIATSSCLNKIIAHYKRFVNIMRRKFAEIVLLQYFNYKIGRNHISSKKQMCFYCAQFSAQFCKYFYILYNIFLKFNWYWLLICCVIKTHNVCRIMSVTLAWYTLKSCKYQARSTGFIRSMSSYNEKTLTRWSPGQMAQLLNKSPEALRNRLSWLRDPADGAAGQTPEKISEIKKLKDTKSIFQLPECRKTSFKSKTVPKRERKVFARLFQKAADSKGRAFGRPSQWAVPYCSRPGREQKEKSGSADPPRMTPRRHFACKMTG